MKVLTWSDAPKTPFESPLFTGSEVTVQVLTAESADLDVNMVNFGRGVRNKFHSHDFDQVLIVTAGRGIVAVEGEEKVVGPGTVVLFPAGEKHWHGATPDSDFSHIYIIKKGHQLTQLED
ncbi:MAG: cupin domain-containing protein [Proteobacteria bacterium]|nr:cupin domain-containing protein [Pseudomonadota bacterium]